MNWDILTGALMGSVFTLHLVVLLMWKRGFFKNKDEK